MEVTRGNILPRHSAATREPQADVHRNVSGATHCNPTLTPPRPLDTPVSPRTGTGIAYGERECSCGRTECWGCLGVLPAPPSPQPWQDEGVATVWHRIRSGSEARVQPGDHGSPYLQAR